MNTSRLVVSLGLLISVAAAPSVLAQQITGSPGATTTIDGRYLPNPPLPFRGEISPNAEQSKPYWPSLIVPPKGAPNILLIMTDDVGFSAPSHSTTRASPDSSRLSRTTRRAAPCSPLRARFPTCRSPARAVRRVS